MGCPPFPTQVPSDRLAALTTRALTAFEGMEPVSFPFLTDTLEYVVSDPDDRLLILAAEPGAKFFGG